MDIEYSDGKRVEAKIRDLLSQETKLDSQHAIAADQYSEWAVRYHLSPERGNLLRHLDFTDLEVLELGAGMGAVSRVLAEKAKSLTVVEGTQSRFAALQERLKDLNNWSGLVANIGEVEFAKKFDVVCVIGVLEYSELYIAVPEGTQKSPFTLFLEKAMSFLKPQGVLVLAIENKLGIKYWSGASEDHTGRLFDGVCGYPNAKSPKTFSRKELRSLLEEMGNCRIEEYFPFPDYKIPTSVLSSELMENHPRLAGEISAYRNFEDYSAPRAHFFSDLLATENLAQSGLLPEFSNSFLFLAAKDANSQILEQMLSAKQRGEIGWHYSSNRLYPTRTIFERTETGLQVHKQLLGNDRFESLSFEGQENTVSWNIPPTEPLLTGTSMRLLCAKAFYFDGMAAGMQCLQDFLSWGLERWKSENDPSALQGKALDALLTNTQLVGNQYRCFDLEWRLESPMPKSWFIFRNVLALNADFPLFSKTSSIQNLKEVYQGLCEVLKIAPAFEADLNREADLQSLVTPNGLAHEYRDALKNVVLNPFLSQALPRSPGSESSLRREMESLESAKNQVRLEQESLRRVLAGPLYGWVMKIDKFFQKESRLRRGAKFVRKSYWFFKHRVWLALRFFISEYAVTPTSDPTTFLLTPSHSPLSRGWSKVRLKLKGDCTIVQAVRLRLEAADQVFFVDLKSLAPGIYGTTLKLVNEIHTVKAEVDAPIGSVQITHAFLRQMPKSEAAFRLVVPQLPEVFSHPEKRKNFLERGKELWRQGKIRGLIAWIHQQALLGDVTFADYYSSWVGQYDTLTGKEKQAIKKRIRNLSYQPLISLVLPVYNPDRIWLEKAIQSVLDQLYPNWELCIADDKSNRPYIREILEKFQKQDPRIRVVYRKENGHISKASNSALELAAGEFIGLLDHDDELAPEALYYMVEELNRFPKADLIYSDEDKIDNRGRRFQPHFKTEWNPELFYSYNLITHFTVLRHRLVKELGGFRAGYEGSQDYDLFLRVIEKTTPENIRHIPKILYHWRAIETSVAGGSAAKPYAHEAARRAIRDHFQRRGMKVEVVEGAPDCHRVKYPLPEPLPLVSILICTRDRIDLMKMVLNGILHETDYPKLEIIIVDNQSREEKTKVYFAELRKDLRIKILSYDAPFNYAAMNNLAARNASGEILALLNNDLKVIHPDWLKEMVSLAVRPETGAVGAKLYYPSERVQHAGVILGIGGVAGHSHKGLSRYDRGYFARPIVPQILSAVTAACLVVRRSVFFDVGGLDEKNLAVAFNDVDFCLRVRQAGYSNVFTPHAELYHYESESRGSDQTPENYPRFERETLYMKSHWARWLKNDPYYNPNLTLVAEDFTLAFPPRVAKPWRVQGQEKSTVAAARTEISPAARPPELNQ